MTHRHVETLIGRLVTDPALRRQFLEDPVRFLRECRDQGFELSAVEFDALASTDVEAIRTFADTIDRRIRKIDIASDSNATET